VVNYLVPAHAFERTDMAIRRHLAPALLLAAAALSGCAGGSAEARRAEALFDKGDHAGARREAESGLERAPRDADLWRIKLRALLATGDARAAVEQYATWRGLRGQEDDVALRALARTTLWQGLRSRSPAAQAAAVRAIERLELDELAPSVAPLIASDDDQVAAAAATALLTAHPQAPPIAVDLLRSDDPLARAAAVDGIGRKAGVHARADLVPMLGDADAQVRRAAVGAVAGFAEDGDLARLVAMARKDPDGPVRARILRALAGRDIDQRMELARQGVADPYLGARQAAVELLVRIDSDEARAALDQVARSPDLHVALIAAAALLRGGAASEPARPAASVFQRALVDPAWTARAAALNATPAASRELALSLAGRGIADRRAEVRLAAARLLMRVGQGERARRELAGALAHPDPLVRLDAAIDLCRLGDERGRAPLDQLARSREPSVRAAAVQAHAAARRITAGLVAALADPAFELRLAAAEILLELTD
jgi:HEAT repeat protein